MVNDNPAAEIMRKKRRLKKRRKLGRAMMDLGLSIQRMVLRLKTRDDDEPWRERP